MTAIEQVQVLRDALGPDYGAQIGNLAARAGSGPSIALMPDGGDYEPALCSPVPELVTCDIFVIAAHTGPGGIVDLLTHKDLVAEIARNVGWTPTGWRSDTVDDNPAIRITATITTEG